MPKFTPEQIDDANSWLYDIFYASGITNGVRAKKDPYPRSSRFDPLAKVVFDDIRIRPVSYQTFTTLDSTLLDLSGFQFKDFRSGSWKRKKSSVLAKYIAYFCADKKLYWDDSKMTPYEMDEIKKTISGGALADFRCFTSQDDVKQKSAKTITASGGSSGTVSSTGPQNGFKSLGPLSKNVVNLIQQNKVQLSGGKVYCIEADKLGKNVPNVFITPLTNSGSAVDNKRAQQVKLGSGNGYPDCKLYWDDLDEAKRALADCKAKFSGSQFSNLHIAAAGVDSNGYFEVMTELGSAYIKALKLNEEILEALFPDEFAIEENNKKSNVYKIRNIDIFDEAFDKYRD